MKRTLVIFVLIFSGFGGLFGMDSIRSHKDPLKERSKCILQQAVDSDDGIAVRQYLYARADNKFPLAKIEKDLFMGFCKDALSRGRSSVVKAFIETNSVDYDEFKWSFKYSPLYTAVTLKKKDLAEFFVARELEVDINRSEGNAPSSFYKAVCLQDHEMVEWMLGKFKNIDFTQCGTYGDTVLHKAVRRKDDLMAGMLLAKGKEVLLDKANQDGETPLFLTIEGGDTKMLKRLIEYGVNVDSKFRNGMTPLQYIVANASLVMAELLLEKAPGARAFINSALCTAVERCDERGVKLLLEYGADPLHVINIQGQTALGLASSLLLSPNYSRYGQESLAKIYVLLRCWCSPSVAAQESRPTWQEAAQVWAWRHRRALISVLVTVPASLILAYWAWANETAPDTMQ